MVDVDAHAWCSSGMTEETQAPPKLLEDSHTEWTTKGYRVGLLRFDTHWLLSAEAEAMALAKGERTAFIVGRLVILDWQMRADVEKWVSHCFSFFGDDDLVAAALEVVRRVCSSLKEPPPSPAGASNPPRGSFQN